MMRIMVAALGILSCLPCLGVTPGPKRDWRIIEIEKMGAIEVRLRYRPVASLDDEEWLGFEFVNNGNEPVCVERASYRIEAEFYQLRHRILAGSGNLASGSEPDLFPHAYATTPVSEIKIPKGVYRVAENPSCYSAALLGLPSNEGRLVKATLHMSFVIAGKTGREMPEKVVHFQFEWRYPSAEGFEKMRKRTSVMLEHPEAHSFYCDAYLLVALLEIPQVSGAISAREIMSAIHDRRGTLRDGLVKCLSTRTADRETVIAFYLTRLQQRDSEACSDLMQATAIWDSRFIEPLVSMNETGDESPTFALEVLEAHNKVWREDRSITHRLYSAVLKRKYGKYLKMNPQELLDAHSLHLWEYGARELAMTHDAEALPLLRPFLDCKEALLDPAMVSNFSGQLPLSYRACDIALDAILTILDGDKACGYQKMGFPPGSESRDGVAASFHAVSIRQVTAWRDEMIAKTKERLAAIGK